MQLPSFLHGSRSAIERKAAAEGRRCARQFQKNGSFTLPRDMLELAPGDVVITYGGSDFLQHLPAWRLNHLSDVETSLCEALEHGDWRQAEEQYEVFFRETAWGALYYATAERLPESAERTAQRIQAVLRSWETLETARYHYQKPGAILGLEELLTSGTGSSRGAEPLSPGGREAGCSPGRATGAAARAVPARAPPAPAARPG